MDEVSATLGGPQSPWTFTDAGSALDILEGAGLDPYAEGVLRVHGGATAAL